MSESLFIFPFGGNAREALDCVLDINLLKKQWHVLGFLDDDKNLIGKEYGGMKVVGTSELLRKESRAKFLAVPGNPKNYLNRKKIIKQFSISEDRFATIIHPSCVVSATARVGFNTLILAHTVLGSGVRVGDHCILLANSTIAHDSQIGDYSCLGANVVVSGAVKIKNNSYIGSGASLIDNVEIGEESLVGLGSTVIRPVPSHCIVAGNPARVIKKQGKLG